MRIVVLVLLSIASSARAQALADRVPSDALLYISWAGANKLTPAYEQSHLKGVMQHSSLPQLFAELGPKIIARIERENFPEKELLTKEIVPAARQLAQTVWQHPTALYVGPMDFAGKVPLPKTAILIQAGKDAQPLLDKLTPLIARIPADSPLQIKAQIWPGDILVISNFALGERMEESLSQVAAFQNAIKQGRPDPAFTFYFDAERVISVVSMGINMGADAKTKDIFRRIMFASGAAKLKRILYTAGFDGKDWGAQAFIEAPSPRSGILSAVLDSEPLSDDVLKLAPKSATWASATRLDLAATLASARNAVSLIDPATAQAFEQSLKQFSQTVKLDLHNDVLQPLGDQWIAFNSPETGHGLLGMTIVNPLRDSAKAEKALLTFQNFLQDLMKQEAAQGGMTVEFDVVKIGDVNVHYLAIPIVSPSWAIHNGRLYVALFPQIVAAAAEHDASGATVLANEDFSQLKKRLAVEKPISLSYMDLPKLAPRGYQMLLALQQGVLGAGDLLGLDTPALVLPPLNKIMPHLAPAYSASWTDDAGWHYRAVSPFPGASLLGGEQALITTVGPALASVALPAVANARAQAMRMQGMANLRQIGLAVHMYATENDGKMPPDLDSLLKYVGNAQVMSNCVYIGQRFTKLTDIKGTADTIIAHEKLEQSPDGTVNLLFGDGHVERVPLNDARQRLAQQQVPRQ